MGNFARQLINHKLLNKKKMKKVFFVFAVAAGVAMTACNNKPAESTEAPKTDSAAVTATVAADTTKAAPVDSSSAKAADTTAAAPAKK